MASSFASNGLDGMHWGARDGWSPGESACEPWRVERLLRGRHRGRDPAKPRATRAVSDWQGRDVLTLSE